MVIIFDAKKHFRKELSKSKSIKVSRYKKLPKKKDSDLLFNFETNILNKSLKNQKEFSNPVAELFGVYENYFESQLTKAEVATIQVDEIASKMASFYEKIRKIVDWKEEHLVRRGAIERILKRKMISKISGISLADEFDPKKIGEPLVLELIHGGHFLNNKIPQKKIGEIESVLEKYAFIFENNPLSHNNQVAPKIKKKINLYNWLLEIAACEIEEILDPPIKNKALVRCMVRSMRERIQLAPPEILSQKEKEIQILIAVLRTLFHLDSPIISYYLLTIYWPSWTDPSDEFLKEIAENIFFVEKEIEKHLNHPLSGKFYNICEKYDTLYLLLGDVLENYSEKPDKIIKTLKNRKKLISQIKKAYNKRLLTLKTRLFRAAIYSTLSVFISGGISLFIFEVPLARFFYGEWKPVAMVVDILLPTIFMAFLVAITKPPRKENLVKILKEVKKITYPTKEGDVYEIKAQKKRGFILKMLISFLYILATLTSLTFTFFVFGLAEVPATSLYIDTLNVAVIVFAALVIRQRSKELTVEEKASFWEFFIDILSIPIAEIGQWLAKKWKEYNIVSVFFIALVDMPFSTFVNFIENWSSFLKEKKSEIR